MAMLQCCICCRLSQSVCELPPGQCVSLLEQLQRDFHVGFLSKLPPPGHTPREKRRKKKRRSEGRRAALLTACEVSEALVAALVKGACIFSVVLLHLPLSVWSSEGLHRDRAVATLMAVQRDVCLPLLEAAWVMVRQGGREEGRSKCAKKGVYIYLWRQMCSSTAINMFTFSDERICLRRRMHILITPCL